MWSETVGLRTRPASNQQNRSLGLGLGIAGLVLRCETRSCRARRHNDVEGHSNLSSIIFSFSILFLEHHYWEINSGVYLLKSKIRQVPLFTSGGLGLKNMVLFTCLW